MIEVFSTAEDQKWDEIVCSMSNFDVYYLSGYVKAFEKNGDGKACLVYIHDNNARLIHVIMKRDISDMEEFDGLFKEDEYYDVVTPYGYGGMLIEGRDASGLFSEYIDFCIANNIVCEFDRFNPVSNNADKVKEFYEIKELGNTVYIDTSSQETIWQNMSSKNRNMIRKAWKSGMQVYWGRAPWMLDSFMEIYNQTMDRDNADEYYYFNKDFYESILYDLKQQAMWFYAVAEEKIIAMSIFLFTNGRMHYHLSGSLTDYRSMAPTNLILYEAAMWACEQGYECLHLGGGVGASCDSLYRFKKAFNRGDDMLFCIGRKIYLPDMYDKLVQLRSESDENFQLNVNFFPQYRG